MTEKKEIKRAREGKKRRKEHKILCHAPKQSHQNETIVNKRQTKSQYTIQKPSSMTLPREHNN